MRFFLKSTKKERHFRIESPCKDEHWRGQGNNFRRGKEKVAVERVKGENLREFMTFIILVKQESKSSAKSNRLRV